MNGEGLRLGILVAGVLLAAIPVSIGIGMGVMVVRHIWDTRDEVPASGRESEEG